MDIANPIRSEAKCAESVKIAMDCARYPPMSYAAMKKKETKATSNNFFSAFLFCSSIFAFIILKLIGVLTGIGVPCMSGCSCVSIYV